MQEFQNMSEDEGEVYIDPRFRGVEPWSKESIDQWKEERRKKYPTFKRYEAANRIKIALEEKKRRICEARAQQIKENPTKFKRQRRKPNHQSFKRRRRDFNPVTQQTNEGFQFPDSDYEEEGVKDGIVMFCGTVKAMKNAQENLHEIDIPISDDEEEEVQENFREIESEDEGDNKPKSTSHVEPGDNSKNIVANSSKVTNTSWGAFDLDGDDEIPEIQSVKIRKEMSNEDTNLTTNSARKNPVSALNKKRQIPLKEKSYAEILKRPKRATTLLETLLDPEIKKERYELLQCVHYVVSNNFFGVGRSNKNAK